MPINRTIWKTYFIKDTTPQWPCPLCKVGYLHLLDDTYKILPLADSYPYGPRDLDPTCLKYTFSAIFKCSNNSCEEHFSSCGHGEVIEEINDPPEGVTYIELLKPEYFFPHLEMFPIPANCPKSVIEEIRLSFRLFFCDSSASANHIRKSVENILTDKGIKRFKNRKHAPISLHDRIKLYEAKDQDIAEQLFAIKWLGNAGSHSGLLFKDDVLDAYEILETVLDDLYVGHKKSLKKKVSLVNKRKGPLKKSKK